MEALKSDDPTVNAYSTTKRGGKKVPLRRDKRDGGPVTVTDSRWNKRQALHLRLNKHNYTDIHTEDMGRCFHIEAWWLSYDCAHVFMSHILYVRISSYLLPP